MGIVPIWSTAMTSTDMTSTPRYPIARSRAGAAALLLIAVAGACSSDDGDIGSATTTADSPAPTSAARATTTADSAPPTSAASAPTIDWSAGAFVGADSLADHGSAAFVLVDGEFRFVSHPDAEDTSISHIDPVSGTAWGWSRDLPVDDPAATQWSWELDLATVEFTDIDMDGASWAVLRGGTGATSFVGKLADDGGTPEDDSDDSTAGFVLGESGEDQRVVRDGYSDIGFTDVNASGLITGFNDFGTLGFVYDGAAFTDLTHPDAYRLFPFSINDTGVIVGFWGIDEDTWYLSEENPAFVATPGDDGYDVERYELPGFTGTGLTAVGADGSIAGMAWESVGAAPSVFVAADAASLPTLHDGPAGTSMFVTGMTDDGVVFGQAFLSPAETADDESSDESAAAAETPISDAVAAMSGAAHSGPFASALHGSFHDLETAAAAAEDAAASGDTEVLDAEIASLAALMAETRAAVAAVDGATAQEADEVAALLDGIDAAAQGLLADGT